MKVVMFYHSVAKWTLFVCKLSLLSDRRDSPSTPFFPNHFVPYHHLLKNKQSKNYMRQQLEKVMEGIR